MRPVKAPDLGSRTRSSASRDSDAASAGPDRSVLCDSLRMRVDVEGVAANESNERDAARGGEIDRQARRRRYRRENRYTREQRLLDNLVRRAPAHEQHSV